MPRQCKLQLFLVALVLLLLQTKMITAGGKHPKPDPVKQICNELINGTRHVILFAKLPDHYLLIVSSPGSYNISTTKLEDTFVFEADLSSMNETNGYFILYNEDMKNFKSRWPNFTGPYDHMFAIEKFLIMTDKLGVNLLEMENGTISSMPLTQPSKPIFHGTLQLSSSKAPTFYMFYSFTKWWLAKTSFNNVNLLEATKKGLNNDRFICKAAKEDQFILQTLDCPKNPMIWFLIAGYVDGYNFLFVETNNSIIRFNTDNYDAEVTEGPVMYHRIAASHFWRSSRYKPTLSTRASRWSTISVTDESYLAYNIIYAILAIVLLLLIACATWHSGYFHCTEASPDNSPPGGSFNQKREHEKRSKQSRRRTVLDRFRKRRATSQHDSSVGSLDYSKSATVFKPRYTKQPPLMAKTKTHSTVQMMAINSTSFDVKTSKSTQKKMNVPSGSMPLKFHLKDSMMGTLKSGQSSKKTAATLDKMVKRGSGQQKSTGKVVTSLKRGNSRKTRSNK